METDVLIIGSGPAGLSTALNLTTHGIHPTLLTRHGWVSPTPRAHLTNQRTFEILRDLGMEAPALAEAIPYATIMPNEVFCRTLAGQEFGRLRGLGASSENSANRRESSPCMTADLPQNRLEPILLGQALSRGAAIRFGTEYQSHTQDANGVTATVQDLASGEQYAIRARYMIGADGGRSQVAADLKLPFTGEEKIAGSTNILFEADLTRYVQYRPGVLYLVVRTAQDPGGAGLSVVRCVRPWHEWLLIKSFVAAADESELTEELAVQLVQSHIGDMSIPIRITAIDPWDQNRLFATRYSAGRVFCVGDAVHRHVPSNGLGSNTAIQDGYNLAWKLALVLKGKAGASLLESYDTERVPVGEQVVNRATKSIQEYASILAILGVDATQASAESDHGLNDITSANAECAVRRQQLREAIAAKRYEFDTHGVEMNQRYQSSAVLPDALPATPADGGLAHQESAPAWLAANPDPELHYIPSIAPGARVPHAWVEQDRTALSTLDLAGKGRFSLLTGPGGDSWHVAAQAAAKHFNWRSPPLPSVQAVQSKIPMVHGHDCGR